MPTRTADVANPASPPEPARAADSVRVSPEGADASEPAIAAGADGRVFVAYVQKSGEAGDLYVRAFERAAGRLSEPVRVNPTPGQAKTWYGDPPTIAIGAGGEVYVGWTAKYPGGARGTILYMSVSRDGGKTFGEPVQVNDDAEPASHGMHSMAIAKDGRIYFAWLDERYLRKSPPAAHAGQGSSPHPAEAEVEPNAELYFAESTDGMKFSSNRKLAGDVCPCCKTSTAISDQGQVAIGYRKVFDGEFRHIAVTSLNGFGDAGSQPVQVSDDGWRINACPVSGPALRWVGDTLEIAWYSGGESGEKGVYASRWTDGSGRSFEPRRLVAAMQNAGSPEWAGERLFWSADGELMGSEPGGAEPKKFGSGKGVVAAQAGDSPVIAFVATDGDRKSVWMIPPAGRTL